MTEGEPDCEVDAEREPAAMIPGEPLPVKESVAEAVPLGVRVSTDTVGDADVDTEPVGERERLGLGEAHDVAERVLLTQAVALGEAVGDSVAVPRDDTLAEGVTVAERQRVGEGETQGDAVCERDEKTDMDPVEVGELGPTAVDDPEGGVEKVPVGAPVEVTTPVVDTLTLDKEERLAEGHAEPVLLTSGVCVAERVTVLQMLRVPARPKVAESVNDPVELCDGEAREVSVWLTLLDPDTVAVTVALLLSVLDTQGLPLTELELEALPVLVPEVTTERLRDSDEDTVPHIVVRGEREAVETSLRDSERSAVVLTVFVTVAEPLELPLAVRLCPLVPDVLVLRELLGERHPEGEREGLADTEGEPSASVRVETAVRALLEDAELQMLAVAPTVPEFEALAVSTTDCVGVAEGEMEVTVEVEGEGVLVLLRGEGVAASPEGLRALDAVGELVPEVGEVAECVAHCERVSVEVPEAPLEALIEGNSSDTVGALVTVALYVLVTVSVADAVKESVPQLDSDGENDTVLVRVEVTLSGSVGRGVEEAEPVAVMELVLVRGGVLLEVPLAEGEAVLEGDVEPENALEAVEQKVTVPVEVGEKETVPQEVDVADCDTVSVLLRV